MNELLIPPTSTAFRCGLADTQRRTGALCAKQHCTGCLPYRSVVAARTAEQPVPVPPIQPPHVTPAPPPNYISRLEHEVLMMRAIREAYELHKADRRDALIRAALQGLLASTTHSMADVARLAVECADAVMKIAPP